MQPLLFAAAVGYALRNWGALTRYTEDGPAACSNGSLAIGGDVTVADRFSRHRRHA